MTMKDGLHGAVGAHVRTTVGSSTARFLAAAVDRFIMPRLWSPMATVADTTCANRQSASSVARRACIARVAHDRSRRTRKFGIQAGESNHGTRGQRGVHSHYCIQPCK